MNVTDCLSQEEYREQYPEGENDSPFMFICKDPIMMTNHFPIKGQHKICKYLTQFNLEILFYILTHYQYYFYFFLVNLDEKIHYAAQKCLMKEIIC